MGGQALVGLKAIVLRRLAPGDAEALAAFYNGLREASKRTFRPLGVTTTVAVDCGPGGLGLGDC
jgi:hypothetical protein